MSSRMPVIAAVIVAVVGGVVGLAVGRSSSTKTKTVTVTATRTETETTAQSGPTGAAGSTAATDTIAKIKAAFLGGEHAAKPVYGVYLTTSGGVRWAALCVDRPGYSNSVFGRALVYRAGAWTEISSFNIDNIGSDPWTPNGSSSDIPQPVYDSLQKSLEGCASRIGAQLGPS